MTRDEARNLIDDDKKDQVMEIVDMIYNDFEVMICENCKHHRYVEKSYSVCDIIEIDTSDKFGCNLFEVRA